MKTQNRTKLVMWIIAVTAAGFGVAAAVLFRPMPAPQRTAMLVPAVLGASTTAPALATPPMDATATAASIAALWAQVNYLQSTLSQMQSASSTGTAPASTYKFFSNIDSCQLNKYIKKGWHIFQMGTVTLGSGGTSDETCLRADAQVIDWVVLSNP